MSILKQVVFHFELIPIKCGRWKGKKSLLAALTLFSYSKSIMDMLLDLHFLIWLCLPLIHWLCARFQVWYHAFIYAQNVFCIMYAYEKTLVFICMWFCGLLLWLFFPFFFQKGAVKCKSECLRSPCFLEIVIALFVSRILQNIPKNWLFFSQN